MPKSQTIPGIGVVEFPDSMTDEAIAAKVGQWTSGRGLSLTPRGGAGQPGGPGISPGGRAETAVGTQELFQEMEAAGAFPRPAASALAQAALPTVGAVAGAMTGPAAPIMEPLGAMAGEGLNQLFGISEPSAGSLAVAGAGPVAGRLGAGAFRVGRRFFPGTRATAETMNELAAEEAGRLVTGLANQGARANELFAMARQLNVRVPLPQTQALLQRELGELTSLSSGVQSQHREAIRMLKGLSEKIRQSGGDLNAGELQAELEGIGRSLGALKAGVKPGRENVARAHGALLDDLDTAAASANPAAPGAAVLQAARQAFLREKSVDELGQTIARAQQIKRGSDVAQFDAKTAIKELQKNRFYVAAFNAEERREIEGLLTRLNNVPPIPPPRGAEFGSGRLVRLAAKVGTGAAAAPMAGVDPLTGAMLGVAVPGLVNWTKNFAFALRSQEGRRLLGRLLTGSDGAVTPRVAAVLGAFAATFGRAGLEEP